jgi:hypothetical protein
MYPAFHVYMALIATDNTTAFHRFGRTTMSYRQWLTFQLWSLICETHAKEPCLLARSQRPTPASSLPPANNVAETVAQARRQGIECLDEVKALRC